MATMLKKVRGITLIALVVTIIILLILATVTITTVTGQNGLFKRTSDAKTATEIAKEKETISTAYMTVASGNADATVKKTELNSEINNELNGETATVEGKDNGPFYITYDKSGRKYTIDANGQTEENTADNVNPDKSKTWTTWPTVGEGTQSNPYLIQSIEDLVAFEKDVNNGNPIGTFASNSSYIYINLDRNLDFCYPGSYIDFSKNYSGMLINDANGDGNENSIIEELTNNSGWNPIGIDSDAGNYFKGTFDGSTLNINHKISNLLINRTESQNQAFFATTTSANIKNLELDNVNISGKSEVSSILALVKGGNDSDKIVVSNCEVSGKMISTMSDIGGIIGKDNGTTNQNVIISNCNNNSSINCNQNYVGGIIGISNSNLLIENCNNNGNVYSNGYAGGIIGGKYNKITIKNSNNYADITGNINSGGYYVAGILGFASPTSAIIQNCTNSGSITGNNHISGISGRGSNTSISNSSNTGKLNGNSGIGGIIGRDEDGSNSIINCYNTGEINIINETSSSSCIGGIAGNLIGIANGGKIDSTINFCYNLGNINGGYSNVGGILGSSSSIITNSYNAGNLSSNNYHDRIGGISGGDSKEISNCYNLGVIDDKLNYNYNEVGGIYGSCCNTINNCFNLGKIITNDYSRTYIGSIAGYFNSTVLSNVQYLSGTYNTAVGQSAKDSSAIVQVNTDSEMKSKIIAYFKTQAGWAEDTNNINNGYPILAWQK